MNHFNLFSPPLFHFLSMPVQEADIFCRYLDLLENSGVGVFFQDEDEIGQGRPGFDPCALFAMVLFAFADNGGSLRDMERRCMFDCRYNYLARGTPDHSTLSVFINDRIKPNAEEIFSLVTKRIFLECGLDCDVVHCDGTKHRALPNKYKFVWRATAKHAKLTEKAVALCEQIGVPLSVTDGAPVASEALADAITELSGSMRGAGIDPGGIFRAKGHRLAPEEKAFLRLSEMLEKCLDYEEVERVCGDRNSYYKTDADATAMCLKEDYYSGLGSNMHPAYSVQAMVSYGLVASYYVSQDRSDFLAFPKALEKHFKMVGSYPRKLSADAGYGNLENYMLMDSLGIEAFVKYTDWEGESDGSRPPMYHHGEDGRIYCLNNKLCSPEVIEGRHPRKRGYSFYVVRDCGGCPFMAWCRRFQKEKEGTEKIFEINELYLTLKESAAKRLLSPEGIEIRVNRSCQVEGEYGQVKWNMGYDRARRTGLDSVSMEVMLTLLASNVRKFFRFVRGENPFGYWKAPPGTKAGSFKKPSAKRLSTKARKMGTKKKQPNDLAKDGYKYKGKRRC